MATTFEFVNHPSQFSSEMLREWISPLPEPDPQLKVETYYLAVFDKEFNYPTPDEYRQLLKSQLINDVIVDTLLTRPPRQEVGFGTDSHDVTIAVYPFVNPNDEETMKKNEEPDLEMVVLITVDSIAEGAVH